VWSCKSKDRLCVLTFRNQKGKNVCRERDCGLYLSRKCGMARDGIVVVSLYWALRFGSSAGLFSHEIRYRIAQGMYEVTGEPFLAMAERLRKSRVPRLKA